MRREILVSAMPRESWVVLLEDEKLVEVMLERPDQDRIIGDIFLGRVEAVLPGIQAAFVNIGTEKAGFLHASDLIYDEDSQEENEKGGRRGRPRARKYPPIQDHIRKGQSLLVQVTKEPIGSKGPRVTAQVSLPGRFLVYMPYSENVGVSRRIEDRVQRAKLRQIAKKILPRDSGGIIIRTVSEEVTEKKLEKEFKRLRQRWTKVLASSESQSAPAAVHREAQLISGVIRDLFSDKFEAVRIDSKAIYNEVLEYVKSVDPELRDRVHLHEGQEPLFDKYGVGEEIQRAFERKVHLKSGGHIVIEPTEALVSIDVNTGRFTGKGKKKDPEKTILLTNLDAAREIAK
ncbi:MAG TPA: Rne/Rng family ribonuclease, partial [Gemmatimonadetes bacterium]|nr:Rne/Rng family ribonuclease [Gemmatimonadota bacterium]